MQRGVDVAWRPIGKRVRCELHDEEFDRGQVCPRCTPADLEVIEHPAPPRTVVLDVEGVAEHEAKFSRAAAAAARAGARLKKRIAGDIAKLRECAAEAERRLQTGKKQKPLKPSEAAKLLGVRVTALAKAADLEARIVTIGNDGRDQSIKARRAAAELAQWREDWKNTEDLQRRAAALKGGGTATATTEAHH